jgi:hypothetical protein
MPAIDGLGVVHVTDARGRPALAILGPYEPRAACYRVHFAQ